MAQQESKPTVVTPFAPDARLEADDFRPIFREGEPNPKAESVPEPVPPQPRKRPAKKVAAKKDPVEQSEPIATVVEELPPN